MLRHEKFTQCRSGRNYKRKSSGGVAQVIRRERRSRSKGGAHARKSLEAVAARKSGVGAGVLEEQNNRKRSHYEERNIDDYVPSAPVEEAAAVAWYAINNQFKTRTILNSVSRNNARNAMTPSVSAVTVIERHGSTATLTPGQPSTNTLYPGLYSHQHRSVSVVTRVRVQPCPPPRPPPPTPPPTPS